MDNFLQHASEDVERMLLGNKCDMVDRRLVSRERGEQIAVEHRIKFLETSAKSNINIDKAFYDLAEAILDKAPNKESTGVSSNVDINRNAGRGSGCCSN
uniref:Uncharacterized protein n=1 Tax=Romanomermis culicivorax TaxID=13658 RepID=A0A915HSU9_ROMCU